jgi:hypothetical protein
MRVGRLGEIKQEQDTLYASMHTNSSKLVTQNKGQERVGAHVWFVMYGLRRRGLRITADISHSILCSTTFYIAQ